MCWLRRAMLCALLSHPYVKDSEIYLMNRSGRTKVDIAQGRLFGGPELIQPGLTLAVYPFHSPFNVLDGVHSDEQSNKSVLYPQVNEKASSYNTLGGSGGIFERGYHACIKLVVQLFFREPSYNQPLSLKVDYVQPNWTYERQYYGYLYQFKDPLPDRVIEEPSVDKRAPIKPIIEEQFNVQILPGEEVLTQWMDVIKFALRDIKVLYPYRLVRNPQVILTDYPTSTWTAKSANLIFHTAYHIIKLDIPEPSLPPETTFPPIQNFNLEVREN